MEGSTPLTQRLGDAKAQELLRAHNTAVRDALKAHSGSEIKHTGDGIMASFGSASKALECAVAIQRAFAAKAAVGAQRGGNTDQTPSSHVAAESARLAGKHDAAPLRADVVARHASQLRVRIGLNAGEPVAEDDPAGRADLFGAAVQLAARVCGHARPGQILCSNVVRELALGKGFVFANEEEVALKGSDNPMRLYEVRWDNEA